MAESEGSVFNITCTHLANGLLDCAGELYELESAEERIPAGSPLFWAFVFIALGLVCFAGMASGLTIGLLSLDLLNLEVIRNSGTPKERKYATAIIPIISRQHLLLCTLLLSNAMAMEALPIFLDRISSPIVAIVISVTMVLFFGEIIPQALCKKFGLAIGYYLSPVVKVLIFILFPIGWPLSKLLDAVLGHDHNTRFARAQLRELVNMHSIDKSGPLTVDETTIIKGALDLKTKTVKNCMTSLEDVFMLEIDDKMDTECMQHVKKEGHSRIPVFSKHRKNVKGILLAKSLLGLEHLDDNPHRIGDFVLRDIPSVAITSDLYALLNQFQTGNSHMAAVTDPYTKDVLGIVTLEDIIEELIQEEILDENDLADEYAKRAIELMEQARKLSRGLKQPANIFERSPAFHLEGSSHPRTNSLHSPTSLSNHSISNTNSFNDAGNNADNISSSSTVELTIMDHDETTISDKTHLMKDMS